MHLLTVSHIDGQQADRHFLCWHGLDYIEQYLLSIGCVPYANDRRHWVYWNWRIIVEDPRLITTIPNYLSEVWQGQDLVSPQSRWDGFNLDAEVLRYEGEIIKKALNESGGSVTRAARLLGITHQGLAFILNGRHQNLLSLRTPVKRRRRSIIRHV